jgi:hypothetical protein
MELHHIPTYDKYTVMFISVMKEVWIDYLLQMINTLKLILTLQFCYFLLVINC